MMAIAIVAVAVTVAIGVLVANPGKTEKAAESAPAISLTITPELMKAAEAGDPEAQFLVGSSMLGDSQLNLAYSTKAVDFLQQAAEKGHGRAMLRVGLLFKQGVGAPQNYALAAKWIERAAKTGEPEAMLEFGRLHREGVGVPRDLVKAYAWLNLAAAARDPVAPRERGEVARQLSPGELLQAQMDSMSGNVRAVSPADSSPPVSGGAPAASGTVGPQAVVASPAPR